VHGVGARLGRHPQDVVDPEVGADRLLAPPDQVTLVRLEPVQAEPVLQRVDPDRADAELARRPEHPDGDLAAVGNEEFADRAFFPGTWHHRKLVA
jgi:hypothetical protein